MFALIDCNNFYASCERVFRPDLNEKPIVVLSNNDGCVIARSNEAKKIGIPMGAPAFKFQDVFKQNAVNVFSANFALYGDMSMRVMSILSSYCPDVENYSIDEAFLNFYGFNNFDLQKYGEEISSKVQKSTGIPISIGFAPTKVLSKVANRIAKKYPKETKSVYIINDDEKRIKALKWLKVEDIWGIGRQHTKKLNSININTAFDFVQLTDDFVKKELSVVELRIKKELEGEPVLDLELKKPKKNISTTRSFEKAYTTIDELRERVATFSVSCAEKLRTQKSCCNAIMVFLRTNYFRKDQKQYSSSTIIKLPFSTNSSIEISKYALEALSKIFIEGYSYKKAGVIIMDFCPENEVQQTLFEQSNPKHKKLMIAFDEINRTIGQHKVRLAIQDNNRIWKMKQENLSPRYTTKLNEIITINTG
jgi:DNA polymerase V